MRGFVFGNSQAQPLLDDREDRTTRYGVPFLASHRALAACARELNRLGDEVVRGATMVSDAGAAERPTVRRSPERCIVQMGPVALTIAWLRGSQDTVAAGELLAIVWHGAVAPRTRHQPERPTKGPAPLGATPLWEQVLTATGESEIAWAWNAKDRHELGPCSSSELAARCVGHLRSAFLEHDAPVAPDAQTPSAA
jgi:hypothetical protein